MEPACEGRFRRPGSQSVGERAAVRAAQPGDGRWLHRAWESKYHYNFWRPITAIRRVTLTAIQTRSVTRLDTVATDLSEAGPRLRARDGRRRGGRSSEAVLRHRRHLVHGVQYDGCQPTAPAAMRRRYFARIPASPRRRPRTRIRASSLGIHFRKSIEQGTEYGRKIGRSLPTLYLRPVH